MKPGKAQNDSVSGDAKLSCTRLTVRSVGKFISSGGCGNWSGRIVRALSSTQLPRARVALVASIRDSSLSEPSRRNTLTCWAVNCLPCNSTCWAWMMATPCGDVWRSDCRSQS